MERLSTDELSSSQPEASGGSRGLLAYSRGGKDLSRPRPERGTSVTPETMDRALCLLTAGLEQQNRFLYSKYACRGSWCRIFRESKAPWRRGSGQHCPACVVSLGPVSGRDGPEYWSGCGFRSGPCAWQEDTPPPPVPREGGCRAGRRVERPGSTRGSRSSRLCRERPQRRVPESWKGFCSGWKPESAFCGQGHSSTVGGLHCR